MPQRRLKVRAMSVTTLGPRQEFDMDLVPAPIFATRSVNSAAIAERDVEIGKNPQAGPQTAVASAATGALSAVLGRRSEPPECRPR